MLQQPSEILVNIMSNLSLPELRRLSLTHPRLARTSEDAAEVWRQHYFQLDQTGFLANEPGTWRQKVEFLQRTHRPLSVYVLYFSLSLSPIGIRTDTEIKARWCLTNMYNRRLFPETQKELIGQLYGQLTNDYLPKQVDPDFFDFLLEAASDSESDGLSLDPCPLYMFGQGDTSGYAVFGDAYGSNLPVLVVTGLPRHLVYGFIAYLMNSQPSRRVSRPFIEHHGDLNRSRVFSVQGPPYSPKDVVEIVKMVRNLHIYYAIVPITIFPCYA